MSALWLMMLSGCGSFGDQAATADRVGSKHKKRRGKRKGKGKRKAADPTLAMSRFRTIQPGQCRWFYMNSKGKNFPVATFPDACPERPKVRWHPNAKTALVDVGQPDAPAVWHVTRKDAFLVDYPPSGPFERFGFDEGGTPFGMAGGKWWQLDLQARTWKKGEETKHAGARPNQAGADASDEDREALVAVGGAGTWKVQGADKYRVAYRVEDDKAVPPVVAHTGTVWAVLSLELEEPKRLRVELRKHAVLASDGGRRPRVYDLNRAKLIYKSDEDVSTSFWPLPSKPKTKGKKK